MGESDFLMMDSNMSMGPCDSVSYGITLDMQFIVSCVEQMSGMNMSMNGMAMQFFFGYQCSFLFSNLNLDTPAGLFGGVVLVIIVAILYEGFKTLREILASRCSKSSNKAQDGPSGGTPAKKNDNMSQSSNVQTPSHITSPERIPLVATKKKRNKVLEFILNNWLDPMHILQSFLHVIQIGVAYILMLVAMTYNGWLFLSVCFGAGLGYFIFARCRRSVEALKEGSDHCHN